MDPKEYLHGQLQNDEQVLWEGRPLKKAMMMAAFFGMLPFCVVWLCFAVGIITCTFISGAPLSMLLFMIPFFAVWLTPVWVWIAGIITTGIAYEKTYYIVTDKRILLMHGSLMRREFENLYYQNVGDLHLAMGFVDNICGTGTIILNIRGHEGSVHAISNIPDAQTVFGKMQKNVFDMASDVYYPNAKRPSEKRGYNTTYTP